MSVSACCLQQCFEAVLQLLDWSWSASHTAVEVDGLKGDGYQAALADMSRLVYISRACLRLLRIYVNEVYPDGGEITCVCVREWSIFDAGEE